MPGAVFVSQVSSVSGAAVRGGGAGGGRVESLLLLLGLALCTRPLRYDLITDYTIAWPY